MSLVTLHGHASVRTSGAVTADDDQSKMTGRIESQVRKNTNDRNNNFWDSRLDIIQYLSTAEMIWTSFDDCGEDNEDDWTIRIELTWGRRKLVVEEQSDRRIWCITCCWHRNGKVGWELVKFDEFISAIVDGFVDRFLLSSYSTLDSQKSSVWGCVVRWVYFSGSTRLI